jgi:hypothetical protein
MIRLPTPVDIDGYVKWARQLIQSLELQQRSNELTRTTATKDAEDRAEAVSWFNG